MGIDEVGIDKVGIDEVGRYHHKIEVAFIELGLAMGTPSLTHRKYQRVENNQ